MTEKEMVGHYAIIERIPDHGETKFVLAEHTLRRGKYVTWSKNAYGRGYDHGHYYDDRVSAYMDLEERGIEHDIPRSEMSCMTKIPPLTCYSVSPDNGRIIVLAYGESGYRYSALSVDDPEKNRTLADALNKHIDCTKAQEAAMLAGSMFGWDMPAADPRNYSEAGEPIKYKERKADDRER